jgi:hypothetical protein
MKKRAEIPRSNNEKPMQIGLDIRDKTAEEELSQDDKELKEMQIGLDIRDKTAEEELSQDDKELKEMQNRLDILYLENKQLRRSFQKRPDMEKFWDDKKLKIGAINRNLRLSSAMIDPCSHRYYLSIKIHDTDEDKGRLIMEDNIHRTNYDIIIRHEDIKRPSKKTETAP